MISVKDIEDEMVKSKMALDIKLMPKQKVEENLLDIIKNHYTDIPYQDIIAVNKALLILKAETETAQMQQYDYNNESLLKLKDYINNDLECQILKAKLEKNEIQNGYNNEALLKLINTTAKKIEKDKLNESEKIDVEKLLSALDKIANKLLDYKYFDAKNIFDLKEYITSDPKIIKGTHLDKKYINQLIYCIDKLINDAEDYLDANELMVLYFGIYLARIKNKEIRNTLPLKELI